MLWMHNEARQGRPSAYTLNSLAARYKGARFRVHEEVVRLYVGVRTIFKPVIEVVIDNRWVTYMWLDHEEVELVEATTDGHSASF
jgi:hypothetical protein